MEGNDELCPFFFKVYWDNNRKRWFIPKKQKGEKVHCGHKQQQPSDIRLEAKHLLSSEDEELAKQSFDSFISTSSAKSLLETRSEGKVFGLSWQQLYHLKRKQQREAEVKQTTSCDKLVHYLSSNENISWLGLFADPTTNLLSIRKKKSKGNSALTVEDLSKELVLGDETDNPSLHVKVLKERESLIHTESGQLMLSVAFTSDSQRMLFDMCKWSLIVQCVANDMLIMLLLC